MQDDPVVLVVTVSASITGNRILYLMHEIVEILKKAQLYYISTKNMLLEKRTI